MTITANIADYDNNDSTDGGGIKHFGGTVNLQNTIVANNAHKVSFPFPTTVADDCKGTLTSQGYNLIREATGCTIGGTTTGNITGQDPQLGPLQDNGGPTETYALKSNSPAIDAGNPSGCTDPLGAVRTTDQRSYWRPVDGDRNGVARCDIGAFEKAFQIYLPLTLK